MIDRSDVYRVAGIVAACTLSVTIAFVGLLALLTTDTPGLGGRFPFYVVVLSVVFTALLITFERYLAEGEQIFITAAVLALSIGVLFALDVEGLFYTVRNPTELVASQLLLYFVAAGALSTGLIYWGVHHWREFVTPAEDVESSE